MRPRRTSAAPQFTRRSSYIGHSRRPTFADAHGHDGADDLPEHREEDESADESAPLIPSLGAASFGSGSAGRRISKRSRPSTSGSGSRLQPPRTPVVPQYGSINYPPSVPGSPRGGPVTGSYGVSGGPDELDLNRREYDTVIDISGDGTSYPFPTNTSRDADDNNRGHTGNTAEEDVCFPVDDHLTDDEAAAAMHHSHYNFERPKLREWPDFSVLEEWSREEKEQRSEGIRAKKMPEPVFVGGRLRPPVRSQWFKDENDAPYRFTYFNEELPATIHSHTISEILQPGQTFRDLFKPEPAIQDDSDYEDPAPIHPIAGGSESRARSVSRACSDSHATETEHPDSSAPEPSAALPRFGRRPTFWLDVLQPTDAEMKVLSRAFGIHPLTVEDIMMQEAREKVELFRSYYLVSYRTFEQDPNHENFMDPVNIYAIVFREGVISFHFSMTPHPANVRRRIRQLRDYINVSADWISYALIDDITDAFGPLIQSLEEEVDDIDDAILQLHLEPDSENKPVTEKGEPEEDAKSDGDMLKRVGDSRRKVMSLYRLMGNKADVIKGFAKRCNEQWEVAPRSEIGLYLGDIQGRYPPAGDGGDETRLTRNRSHCDDGLQPQPHGEDPLALPLELSRAD